MNEMTGKFIDDEMEIDLVELLVFLFRHAWLIVLSGIFGGVIAFFVCSFGISPQYKSSTSIFILNKNDSSTLTYSDVQLGSQLTKDYARLIKSRSVLEAVIEACGLPFDYGELNGRISVNAISDTRLIEITVVDEKSDRAQMIADEVRKKASDRIMDVMAIQAVNVVDEANLPMRPFSPSVGKWTGIGLMFGIFLCVAVLTVRFLMDDTVKTSEDVEKYLNLSTLALIPRQESNTDKKHVRQKLQKRVGSRSVKSGETSIEIDLDREDTIKE